MGHAAMHGIPLWVHAMLLLLVHHVWACLLVELAWVATIAHLLVGWHATHTLPILLTRVVLLVLLLLLRGLLQAGIAACTAGPSQCAVHMSSACSSSCTGCTEATKSHDDMSHAERSERLACTSVMQHHPIQMHTDAQRTSRHSNLKTPYCYHLQHRLHCVPTWNCWLYCWYWLLP